MSNCRLCKRLVGSVSVTATATDLVINIPDANYNNCEKLCVAVLQEIPTTATRGLPVSITIGAGTTLYPVVMCNCVPLTQEYIGQGNVYPLKVQTNSTSGVFKMLTNVCKVSTNLNSIPASTGD